MRVEFMNNDVDLFIDLSEYPQEVTDYVFDQLSDRLFSDVIREVDDFEVDADYEHQTLEITCLVTEIVRRIIEEKEHDIDYERRHGERDD